MSGWVGVLNDMAGGEGLFPSRSSALLGHQVLLTWPRPLSTLRRPWQAARRGRCTGLWCLQGRGCPVPGSSGHRCAPCLSTWVASPF